MKAWFFPLLFLLFLTGCSTNNSRLNQEQKQFFFTPKNWRQPINSSKALFRQDSAAKSKKNQLVIPAKVISPPKGEQMEGTASWYGAGFHGKLTTNGERYDQNKLTAAHETLPINTWVEVTNLENNLKETVRINDRRSDKKIQIIVLTRRAASNLKFMEKGTARVSLKVISFPKDYNPSKGLASPKQFVVQVAAFKSRIRAQAYRQTLADKHGPIPFLMEEQITRKFYVFAGPFDTKLVAGKISNLLKKQNIKNFVRSYKR